MNQRPTRFPGRLRRLDRLAAGLEPLYFVTFNTAYRRALLDRTAVHKAFRAFCRRAHEDHGIAVGRYVLMPDHAHLFVSFPAEGITLSRWVQSLRSVVGRQILAEERIIRIGEGFL